MYECLDGVEAFLFAEVQVDLLFGDLLNHVADLLPAQPFGHDRGARTAHRAED